MGSTDNSINKSNDSKDIFWKRRPSEIRGYNRTLYTTTEDGDYIRVDYNIKEKKVRIYLEDTDEGGNPYYSVITQGRINIERNATTGRVCPLEEKLSKRADVISTIPNREVLKLINNNYGISERQEVRIIDSAEAKRKEIERKKELNRIRKKYFKTQPFIFSDRPRIKRPRQKFSFIDLIDFLIGISLCVILYSIDRSFVTVGVLAAFIGIFMGLLDVYQRERQLVLTKMFFFLISGMISYIYGYYIL